MIDFIKSNEFFGVICFSIIALIMHFSEKVLLKKKIHFEDELFKFTNKNVKIPKMEYNLKKYYMKMSSLKYKTAKFGKWYCLFLVLFIILRQFFID